MATAEDDAADSEALLQFLYMAPIGLVQAHLDGEIVLANPLCAQLLMPLSRDGQLHNLFDAMASVAPDLQRRVLAFEPSHGLVCDGLQLQVVGSGGSAGAADKVLSLTLMKLDRTRLMAVIGDVTQAVRRDRELRRSQEWIQGLVSGASDYALLALDGHGCATNWNPGIARVTGYDAQSTVGRPGAMFFGPGAAQQQAVVEQLHEADASGWSISEGWRARADGSRFWGSCLIAPLHGDGDGDGEPRAQGDRSYSLVIRDISDRRDAHEALRLAISCDHLTGLHNRRTFFQAAEVAVERWRHAPRPLALVMVDADHFKGVNDAHGHAAGDAVLCHLAACMTATFRGTDLIARVGGEEFVALLRDTTPESAMASAERLRERIAAAPVQWNGRSIHYTISAGVALMSPGDGCDGCDHGVDGVNALYRRADEAMYAAKASGRNRAVAWRCSPADRDDRGDRNAGDGDGRSAAAAAAPGGAA